MKRLALACAAGLLGAVAQAQPAPRAVWRDCATCPELVALPAGEYRMGSTPDDPEHQADEGPRPGVRIAVFAIGRTEVTVAQYLACVGAGACEPPVWTQAPVRQALFSVLGASVAGADHPVTGVSWRMAQRYTQWLSQTTGQAYHLPSETQWEYAARAGTATRWSTGDDAAALATHAWFDANSGSALHPVASRAPNPWGLHDLHGNVREWCADWLDAYPGGSVTDPAGAANGVNRVLRGGSWYESGANCRSSFRQGGMIGLRFHDLGFRVALRPAK